MRALMRHVTVTLLLLSALSQAAQQITIVNFTAGTITGVPVEYMALFPAGAVPTGNCVRYMDGATPVTTQVDVESWHPDGSMKEAWMTAVGSAPSSNKVYTVELVAGACVNTGYMTKAQMQAMAESSGGAANGWNGKWTFTAASTSVERSCRAKLDAWDGTTLNELKVSRFRGGSVMTHMIFKDLDPASDAYSLGWHYLGSGVMEVDADPKYKSLATECHMTFWPSLNQVRMEFATRNSFLSRRQAQVYDVTYDIGPTSSTRVYAKTGIQHKSGATAYKVFWDGAGTHPTKVCTGGTMTGHNEKECVDTGGTLSQKFDIAADLEYLKSVGFVPNYLTDLNPTAEIADFKANKWGNNDKGDYGKGQHSDQNSTNTSEDWNNTVEGSPWTRQSVWYFLVLPILGQGFKDIGEMNHGYQFPGNGGNAHTALFGVPAHFIEYATPTNPEYCGALCTTPANQTVSAQGRPITVHSRPTAYMSSFTGSGSTNVGRIDVGSVTTTGVRILDGGWAHHPELSGFYYWKTGSKVFYDSLMEYAHLAFTYANPIESTALTWPYSGTWTLNSSGGGRGFVAGQPRGRTWGLNAVAHAIYLGRDGTPEKEYLYRKFEDNRAMEEGFLGITSTANYDSTCIPNHDARVASAFWSSSLWCYGRIVKGRDNMPNPLRQPGFAMTDTAIPTASGYSGEMDTTKGGGWHNTYMTWYYMIAVSHWVHLGFTEWNTVREEVGKKYVIPWGGHPSQLAKMSRIYTSPIGGMEPGSGSRIRVMNITKASPAVVEAETAHGYTQCDGAGGSTVTSGSIKFIAFGPCPGHTFEVDDWVEISNIPTGNSLANVHGARRVVAITSTTVTVMVSNSPSGAYAGATIKPIGRICCPREEGQWDLGTGHDEIIARQGMPLTVVNATQVIPSKDTCMNYDYGSTNYSLTSPSQVTFPGDGTTIYKNSSGQYVTVTSTATTVGASATVTFTGFPPVTAHRGNCFQITGGTNFITGTFTITSTTSNSWTFNVPVSTGNASGLVGVMGLAGRSTFDTRHNTLDFNNGCAVGSIGCNTEDERQRTYITKYRNIKLFQTHDERVDATYPGYDPVVTYGVLSYTAKYVAALASISDCCTSDPITGITWATAFNKHDPLLADIPAASWESDCTWCIRPLAAPVDNALITTTSLPSGQEGVAYSQGSAYINCGGSQTWSISTGTLPGWATLNTMTGVISGTPDAAGTTNFTLSLSCGVGGSDTQDLSLIISPAAVNFLTLDKISLDFTWQTGSPLPDSQTFTATATDAGTDLARSVFNNIPTSWITATPSATVDSPQLYTVSVTPTGLTPGVYTGEVQVYCTPACFDGTKTIVINLIVTPAAVSSDLKVQAVNVSAVVRWRIPYVDVNSECTVQWATDSSFEQILGSQLDGQAGKMFREFTISNLRPNESTTVRSICPVSGIAFQNTVISTVETAGTVTFTVREKSRTSGTFNFEYGLTTSYGTPSDGTCAAGTCTSGSVSAPAGSVLHYRWRVNGVGDWIPRTMVVGRAP
jgi:hypothetical protein